MKIEVETYKTINVEFTESEFKPLQKIMQCFSNITKHEDKFSPHFLAHKIINIEV